jgi:hypothetical protein
MSAAAANEKPSVLPPVVEDIPEELTAAPRWMGWRHEFLRQGRRGSLDQSSKNGERLPCQKPRPEDVG